MWPLVLYLVPCLAIACLGSYTRNNPYSWPPSWTDFKDPPVQVRPRFRYWLPDASVEVGPAVQDVARAKQVGAGGLEVLGFYGYETTPGQFVPVDWTTYNWGGDAWRTLFKSLLQAHQENGLRMDFALGASMGQGVPADWDNEGLAWDLFSYNFTVSPGGSFDAKVPGWGSGTEPQSGNLVAVISGLVLSSVNTTGSWPSLPHGLTGPRNQITLAAESLNDITSQVTSDGHLSINFPIGKGEEYAVFVIYEYSFHHAVYLSPSTLGGPQTVPTSFLNNGSWAVDHFSAKGANVTAEFWEKYLLGNGTRELIAEVARYGWEDSVEISNNVYWTPALLDVFEKTRGYSLRKWLPIILHQNGFSLNPPASTWWITDEDDAGNSHIADYRTTLGELYGEYLQTLNQWLSSMGVQFSAQVGYNMPLDMQRDIPLVHVPECESLGFNNDIDAYRQYTGPANLAGKKIISSELGADAPFTYQQNMTRLLWEVNRSIVGSVNQFVLHGFPYSGSYPNTTWPSFDTFAYFFSEMHGPHQPGWEFYRPAIDYIARVSLISQKGVVKKDIAFYSKYTSYQAVTRDYPSDDLNQAGYTYDYINPDNFDLPSASVSGGVLAPDKQAFKAMIVQANQSMTTEGITRLATYARAGLPLIFLDVWPSRCLEFNATSDEYVVSTLDSISHLENVHLMSHQNLAQSLQQLGIQPRVHIQTTGQWYTNWRHDSQDGIDYVFLFNDVERSSSITLLTGGLVKFATTSVPYRLDPWTGQYTPILLYNQTDHTTEIFLELAEGESVILAFIPEERPNHHFTSTRGPIFDIAESASSNLTTLKVRNEVPGSPAKVFMEDSHGKTYSMEISVESAVTLQNWTLIVEHWDPPKDLYDMSTTIKWNSTYTHLTTLRSWRNISEELQATSGRGFYTTSFTWSPGTSGLNSGTPGAYLELPPISHTVQAVLNSHLLPPLNIYHPTVDITPYLVPGNNTLEIVIATPLGNALRPIWKSLVTGGHFFGGGTENIAPVPVLADYGLVGEVTVVPFVQCDITWTGKGH